MSGLRRWRMRHLHQPSMLGWRASHGSGGCRPPPAFAAPLRCALTSGAPPRMRGLFGSRERAGDPFHPAAHVGASKARGAGEGVSAGVCALRGASRRRCAASTYAGGRRGKERLRAAQQATGGGGRQPPDRCEARQPSMLGWCRRRMRRLRSPRMRGLPPTTLGLHGAKFIKARPRNPQLLRHSRVSARDGGTDPPSPAKWSTATMRT